MTLCTGHAGKAARILGHAGKAARILQFVTYTEVSSSFYGWGEGGGNLLYTMNRRRVGTRRR